MINISEIIRQYPLVDFKLEFRIKCFEVPKINFQLKYKNRYRMISAFMPKSNNEFNFDMVQETALVNSLIKEIEKFINE